MMALNRGHTVFLLAMLCVIGLFAGCNTGVIVSSQPQEEAQTDPEPPKTEVRLMGLSGSTTMGMAKLLGENEKYNTGNIYQFEMQSDASALTAAIVRGEVDIAVLPLNLASVLYNNTGGGVKLIALNTLGVLYIVETGESIASIEDLRGKTLYATGKGTIPELTLNHLLAEAGITPGSDVTIEYKTEPGEVAAIMAQGEAIAMLPQPFVTVVMNQNDKIRIALDITQEWDKLSQDSSVVTGVAVVRTEFLNENPEAVEVFLSEYHASINYVNDNIAEAAQLIEGLGIVPAAVAQKAIPLCNLVYISGDEMRTKAGGFLKALYEQDPASVGGNLPDDAFYYKK